MSGFFFMVASGLVWMGLSVDLDLETFIWGAALGAALWFIRGQKSHRPFGMLRALWLLWLGSRLTLIFLWELVIANLDQLRLVLSPRIDIEPGWVEVPCSLETMPMRALLGTLLTLTPGSLTFEENTDEEGRWTIHMHLLDTRGGEASLERARLRFEAPLRQMENL